MCGRTSVWKCLPIATGCAALLAASLVLRLNPGAFDHAAARALNRLAVSGGRGTVNQLANAITFPAVQGVGIVALVCGCWFARASREARAPVVRGLVAAVLAVAAAHVLQMPLPPMVKPIFDPALLINPPDVLDSIDVLRATANPASQSSPSERSTLFAGLAIAVYAASRPLGAIALPGTAAVELCRIYLGMHYPSDILGSFFLAATVFWLGEATAPVGLDRLALRWERAAPATFYVAGFAGCYCLATAFEDLRDFLALLSR